MTEVEQKMDVCLQSHAPSSSPNSPDHRIRTPPSPRDHHRHKRHTVYNPHTHIPHKRRSPQKHSSPNTRRTLPPGWEVVNSEGGMYYWQKSTGKTTWKFPSSEAKEHKRRQQAHTYINIRPGHKPHVVKQSSDPLFSPATMESGSNAAKNTTNTADVMSAVPNGMTKMSGSHVKSNGVGRNSAGARSKRGGDQVAGGGENEVVMEEDVLRRTEHFEVCAGSQDMSISPPSQETEVEINGVSPSQEGMEGNKDIGLSLSDSLSSDSPSGVRRQPLVVHHYENFPFNAANSAEVKRRNQQASVDKACEGVEGATSPSSPHRGRAGSNISNASSAPPLPERRYSESEVSSSPAVLPSQKPLLSPTPSESCSVLREQTTSSEQRDPLQSRPREVQREVTEHGSEYARVNPAWKKNVKGRAPSLSGENDGLASLGRSKSETPPPLPNRPAELSNTLERPGQNDARGYVDLDSDFNQKKRAELNISNRFCESVEYAEVHVNTRTEPSDRNAAMTKGLQTHRKMGSGGYEEIVLPEPPLDENNYATVDDSIVRQKQGQQSGALSIRNQRWLKTQSAFVTSSPAAPSPHHHTVTSTKDTPIYINCNETRTLTPDLTPDEEKPALPPKSGKMESDDLKEYNISENSRRLDAMHVTMRRPSEESRPTELKLSKEALLLRSGVTLRPGVRPPRSPNYSEWVKMGRASEASSEPSESDEEDGLEPVSRAIKSLESRITAQDSAAPLTLSSPDDQAEEEMKLMWIPDGPPNWKQYQKRPHNYEDVEIMDGSPPHHYHGGNMPRRKLRGSARSVGNIHHMAWDESDVMSQSSSKAGKGNPLVSASQPCLINVNDAFPHLVKPDRVSEKAFQLRKLRLLQHKYEDIDIPVWAEMGAVSGSVMSVGDVNMMSPAARDSWVEAEKDSAMTESGSQLPKGWQRMVDEQNKTYYWHIPTGSTQYTRPNGEEILSVSVEDSVLPLSDQSDYSPSSSAVPYALSSPLEVRGHCFSACYLGNCSVEESDLVRGKCVKVVHDIINKIHSSGKQKGKAFFLVIQGMELQWVEPESSCPATIQPINRIRVWGIGLENDRDFGYVARDQVTKKHKCHVFRCDMPARAVAKALLENHKMSKSPSLMTSVGKENGQPQGRAASPDLPSSHKHTQAQSKAVSPPSRIVENAETMSCVYIGSCEVPQSQGIEILNTAVEKLCTTKSHWININISIATSNITITDTKSDRTISEHRVRFLCFLGIAKDDSFCGYILESGRKQDGEKTFLFHGFKMEPNTDRLCLALHKACQARYQRVLNSNPNSRRTHDREFADRGRSKSTSSILGRIGSFKKNKKEDDSKVFTVQYLGCQQVARSEGLEVVKRPIQQLSVSKSSSSATPTNLVNFEVSVSGLSMTDPQKRLFSRKNFSVKHITYVVRIRNYFAFVVRDSGKYQCHVFLETSVPAATIVTTIQRMLAPEPSKKR